MPHESLELALVPMVAKAPPIGHDRMAASAGPGWFDSSWELHRGLDVREGWCGDAGLRGWIESFLDAQRTAGRTASPSASTAIA
jgi:hypothetical protein